MAKLGGVLIENLGPRFVDAVTPTSTRSHETPSNVKRENEDGDLAGFTVRQDPQTWANGAYGIVALGTAAYAALSPDMRTQTMTGARELADALNRATKPSITVKAATNQSKKF